MSISGAKWFTLPVEDEDTMTSYDSQIVLEDL